MVNKWNEFQLYVHTLKPDLIAITETWGRDDVVFILPGFELYRKDRQDRMGGGVLIYVSSKFNSKDCVHLNESTFDQSIWCTISFANYELLFGCIYRSPDSSTVNDENLVQLIYSANALKKGTTLIVGDF